MMAKSNGVLIVMAMREEAQHVFDKLSQPVVFTGLGKVNAAYHLMRALNELRQEGVTPKAVVNFGTAGSPKFATHSLVECTHFVQRDMDLSPLGFDAGVTPFEDMPQVIEVPKRFPELPTGRCGTGDSFEVAKPRVECDVVDMEAYAMAKICLLEDLPFISLKYISDGSDHNASNDWSANLPRAAKSFGEWIGRVEALFS